MEILSKRALVLINILEFGYPLSVSQLYRKTKAYSCYGNLAGAVNWIEDEGFLVSKTQGRMKIIELTKNGEELAYLLRIVRSTMQKIKRKIDNGDTQREDESYKEMEKRV